MPVSIRIVYEAQNGSTTETAVPDASGRFETEITVPTTATIPSTNPVKISFSLGENQEETTTTTHSVPKATISLSETSGSPGTTVTVSGEGFKAYVPVTRVRVGSLEVTPTVKGTDAQGMVEFDITIPGLDNGLQTVEVDIGKTVASVGFTVTPSGVAAGDITASAKAVENLGENFVIAWHFNNDTKSWSFYDGEDGSDLANFITGETYLIMITSDIEAILNGKTKSLTCVNGNCWNVVVW